jgi:hypothetical protein
MSLLFSVGEVPKTKSFQFADLAELQILVGLNTQVSKADLEYLIQTGRQDSDPDGKEAPSATALDASDGSTRCVEDVFKQFSYRRGALDEIYPYSFQSSLIASKASIDQAGYVYLFCLLCSRLKSFSGIKGFTQRCARAFTELSKSILAYTLNESADVFVFDAGSEDRRVFFHTDLRKALPLLAEKLNARPESDVINQQSSSGDGGIDLVAIHKLNDSAKGVLSYFAQCAAQQDGWPKKTLESRLSQAFFKMAHPPSNLLFTPVMYRSTTGQWINDLYSQECVIIDRLRLLKIFQRIPTSSSFPIFSEVKDIVDLAACATIE